jgi:hypothetical protein
VTSAKKHHQVPQFLLRNFAFHQGRQLHAFDKSSGREFVVSVEDAAAQGGFYNFSLLGESVSIETELGDLDTAASVAIARILAQRNLTCLSNEDREWLSLFVCVQLARSPNWRLMQADLTSKFLEHSSALGVSEETEVPRDTLDQALALASIADARRWVPLVLEKSWVLQQVENARALFVSDSPLTLHNHYNFGPYGNIGLAVPGVEIQLPLSSDLNLWMVCPTFRSKLESGCKAAVDLASAGQPSAVGDKTFALMDCIRRGRPMNLTQEHVTYYNHLQVRFSARFVYSRDGDFSLVRQMLQNNLGYRSGIRFKT